MRQLRQEQPVASALKHKQYAACLGVCGAYLHVMVELLLRCRFGIVHEPQDLQVQYLWKGRRVTSLAGLPTPRPQRTGGASTSTVRRTAARFEPPHPW